MQILRNPFTSHFLFALGLSLCFMACGPSRPKPPPPGDPSLPEIDVLQLKENSEEALRMAQENRMELQSIHAKVKELEGRMASVSDAISNLPLDRLDTLDKQVLGLRQDIVSLDDRITRIPAAPPPVKLMATFRPNTGGSATSLASSSQSPTGKSVGDSEEVESNKSAHPSTQNQTQTKPISKEKSATKDSKGVLKKAAKPTASEATAYKNAFDQYYAGKYSAARKAFEALIHDSPNGAYADNSQYWIGECEFAQGRNTQALEAFNRVLDFAESEKFDDAQLKIGYAQLRLGNKKAAEEAFRKLLSLYPDSEYSERAKQELAKLP